MKLLLLDRDGTVTQNRARPGDYINDPDEIELIPGVLERLQEYADAGWSIALISNQGGVEKGFITEAQCRQGFQRTFELAPMISIALYCPFAHPSAGDHAVLMSNKNGEVYICLGAMNCEGYRKPNPGMILDAIEVMTERIGDIETVLFVGDRSEDEQAAKAANVAFLWADEWRNQPCLK